VYYPIAGAMSRIAYGDRDLNIRAVVESSGASVANAQLIGAGDADLALLQNDIAYYAARGGPLAEFKGNPVTKLTGMFTIFPEAVHIVARQASGVKSAPDLKGKRVVLGPPASGTEQNALQILESYGMRESDLGVAERTDAVAAATRMREGQVDAAFFTTGVGSAVVADTLRAGQARLVGIGGPGGGAWPQVSLLHGGEDPGRRLQGAHGGHHHPGGPGHGGRSKRFARRSRLQIHQGDLRQPRAVSRRGHGCQEPHPGHGFERNAYCASSRCSAVLQGARHQPQGGPMTRVGTALNGMPIPLHPEEFNKEKGIGR
jgi:TRAP-type uncharacterized transport system substrate-binding protein